MKNNSLTNHSVFRSLTLILFLLLSSLGHLWADNTVTIKVHNVNGNGDVQSGTPYIYFWEYTGESVSWDGSKEMASLSGSDNWYYYTFTNDNSFSYIIRYNSKGSQSGNLSVSSYGDICINVLGTSVDCPTVTPTTYYIKHNWDGNGWEWQEMSDDDEDGTWTYEGKYGGTGCNWNTKADDSGATWISSPTLVNNPSSGDDCEFAFNSTSKTITITKVQSCTTPTISWSTVPVDGNVGSGMTAGVTTNQSNPSITWTSSAESVATVSNGVITYVGEGTTTISAKYTGDGSTYCDDEVSVSQEITAIIPRESLCLQNADENIIFFDNSSKNWASVYCYVWSSSSKDEKAGSWPGTAMTRIGTTNYYYWKPSGTPSDSWKVIFSNNGASQTDNLTFTNRSVCNGSTWTTVSTICGATYYTITFLNGDGSTLETLSVAEGTTPSCSKTPTKASTATTDYTFNGWSPSLYAADKDQTYTPTWTESTHQYAITFGNTGSGSVTAQYDGADITSGYSITTTGKNAVFTATPASGYYLEGWYSNAACTSLIQYATNTTGYTYTASNVTADLTVYAKFVAIPTIAMDGNWTGHSWNSCTAATSSTSTSYTWILSGLTAQSASEFCFKPSSSCSSSALVKPNMGYVTYSGTNVTLGNSGSSNYNFTMTTSGTLDVTIIVSYGAGINVTASAGAAEYTGLSVSATPSGSYTGTPSIDKTTCTQGQSVNVTAPSAVTGYTFYQWTSSNGSFGTPNASSSTFIPTANNAVAVANFKAKTYAITLDKNGGTSNGSATATYNAVTMSGITAPKKSGYHVEGYYLEDACTTKLMTASGSLVANISGYTDANGKWIKDAITTLYTKWEENTAASGITIYVRSDKGGVVIGSGNKSKDGGSSTSINGTSVSQKADCESATWYTVNFADADKIEYLYMYASGCATNSQPFTLDGEGNYYFDCTASKTTQVDESEYCKTNDITIYVYSSDWNSCTPKIYSQWKTSTSSYGSATERAMETVACDATHWYKLVYSSEDYASLASLQIELRIYYSTSSWQSHKINSDWTTLVPGATIYWDVTSGCGNNSDAPTVTDKRPCEEDKTYSVTYDVNGGSAAAPTQEATAKGGVFTVQSYSGTKTGYTFGGWNDGTNVYQANDSYAMPAKNVTFTAVWNKEASSTDWYLVGSAFGNSWSTTSYPFNMSYRGADDIFYRVVNFSTGNSAHIFKLYDGTNCYSQKDITSKTTVVKGKANAISIVQDNNSGHDLYYAEDKEVWAVYDVTNSRFWIEDFESLFDVTVTNTVGDATGSTYTLKNSSDVECAQFASGEKYTLTISPKDGYGAVITVDGEPAQGVVITATPQSDMTNVTTYTYTGTIANANQSITITYEKLTPIVVKFRLDASSWNKADGYEPMVQWTTTDYDTWSGWPSDYSTRIHKLPGFDNWYYYTFDEAKTTLKWQLKNGGVGYDNTDAANHSGQIQVSIYDENKCYAISETTNSYGQRTPSSTTCPEVQAALTVNGGEKVGSTAVMTATSALSTTWVSGYTVQYTYSYQHNSNDWVTISPEDGQISKLVDGVGTYTYRVVVDLVRTSDNTIVESGMATKTIEVATPSLIIEPSTTAAATDAQVSVKPTVTGTAQTDKVYICWKLLDTNSQAVSDITFTDNGDGTYSFTTPASSGTYTIHADLKIGNSCDDAVIVTTAEKAIAVGSLTATLSVSPESPITGNTITLSVSTSATVGTVYYTYSVKASSNPTTQVLASHVTSSSNSSFTVPCEDEYTFTVVVSDDNNTIELTKTIKTGVTSLYMKYCWDKTNWSWQLMTYAGDDIYKLYSSTTKYWTSSTLANTNSSDNDSGKADHTIVTRGTISDGDVVTYFYDKLHNTLYAYAAGVHRLKSVTEHGTFYSNVPNSDNQISFYATATGSLYLQTLTNGEWTDSNSALSISIPADGIFVASMDGSGNVSNLTTYSGKLSAYTTGSKREYKGTNTFTDFSASTTTYYDHYYMEYRSGKTEFGATVGNDINIRLANTLCTYSKDISANVRYEYDGRTNKLSRTMIGSASADSKFLVIYGEGLTKEDGTTALTKDSPLKLSDCENWVYSARIKGVKPEGSRADINGYIYAHFNDQDRWILASTGRETATDAYQTILGGTTTAGSYDILIMYDYKLNRLTAGWSPKSDISIDNELIVDANILFIREEKNDVKQITLVNNDSKVASLEKAIYVQKLLTNTATTGKYYYLFSLPFDCKVKDIFGLAGNYMVAWGIQRYAGEIRAAQGWFEEDGQTFWRWVGINETLKAGEGYSLMVNRSKQSWYGNGANYLYFPSSEDGFSLTKSLADQVATYEPLHCLVDRSGDTDPADPTRDRRAYDSNWHLIGSMACNNITINDVAHKDGDSEDWMWNKDGSTNYPDGSTPRTAGKVPNFIYEIVTDATGKITAYTPKATINESTPFVFHAFTSYMVQFEGTINWAQYTQAEAQSAAAGLAPRRAKSSETISRKPTTITLSLENENELADQTFIQLSENGTTGFDYNRDLTKIESSDQTQLWSVTANTDYAGNVLPLQIDTVPLTVVSATDETLTFSLPQICAEYSPVLIDTYAQSITDLNQNNYSVQLEAGKWTNRFYLVFTYRNPGTDDITTSTGETIHKDSNVSKVMINGILYIIRDGRLYNSLGARMK